MAYRTYSTANGFIVDSQGKGDFTTIQAAINAATAPKDIFLHPGTYNENLTLKPGVNITGFTADGESNAVVTINGKCTFSSEGVTNISNVRLQNNIDFSVVVSGSAGSILNLNGCTLSIFITAISYTSTSTFSQINLNRCDGNIGPGATSIFTHSSAGVLSFNYCLFQNTGGSTIANTVSSGILSIFYSNFFNPITTSGNSRFGMSYSSIDSGNTKCLILGGSAEHTLNTSSFTSGTATAITISNSSTVVDSYIFSSNATAAIDGAGTINYCALFFIHSSTITVVGQNVLNEGPSRIIGSTNIGNINTLSVINADNTNAASGANITAFVGGTSAGDPTYQAIVNGVTTWSWGADNSIISPSADPWVLAASGSLGTTNVISATKAGQINYPLQPAFSAYKSSPTTNVTGDSTAYTVLFDTKIFDVGTNYTTGTGIFTAPINGKYFFTAVVDLTGMTVADTSGFIQIVATSRTLYGTFLNIGAIQTAGSAIVQVSGFVDMTATDTARINVTVSGSTKTTGVFGQGSPHTTYFQGWLVV